MEDYRQIQREILAKRRSETEEYIRRVMKRMERPARPILVAQRRAADPLPQPPAIRRGRRSGGQEPLA